MNQTNLIEILNRLNLDYSGHFKNGWLSILCPFHNDKHFGNCFISEESVIKCFSCGKVSNLYNLIKNRNPNFSSKQIFEFLGQSKTSKLETLLRSRNKQEKTKEKSYKDKVFDFETIPVDLNLYYCKTRNFSKDWLKEFDISEIVSGFYKNYFLIPIRSNGKIVSYEFRKSREYEIFLDFYKDKIEEIKLLLDKSELQLEDFRKYFKETIKEYTLSEDFHYLKKSKTLYPSGSSVIKEILFNYEFLNKEEDLYICEGIAGTAEIWNSVSKNVTCLFGALCSTTQMSILKTFKKKKILVADYNTASDNLIENLSANVPDVWVYQTQERGMEFLLRKSKLLSEVVIR